MDAAAAPPPAAAPPHDVLEVHTHSNETISVSLADVFDSPTEDDAQAQIADVVGLLSRERAPARSWVRFVEQCWLQGRARTALETADTALAAQLDPRDRVPLFCQKAAFHLALARKAPKLRLDNPAAGPIAPPRDPNHPEWVRPGMPPPPHGPMLKADYLFRAAKDIENAEAIDPNSKVVRDVKAAWCMASGQLDQASKLWEQILAEEPTHLMALMGRARIQFSQKSFRPALKTYQFVLQLKSDFLPDPRIGIGLCFYMLGDHEKARRAWERSMAVNPSSSSPSAPLLLGLLHLNRSKDPLLAGGSEARTAAYSLGLTLVQQAFKKDNTSASAAAMGPMAAHFLSTPGGAAGAANALKLAERMLAFADARLLVGEAHLARARALDADPATAAFAGADVLSAYQRAAEAVPDLAVAHLGAGGVFVRMEQFPQAIFAFETLLRRAPKCVEALVSLAAIHTHLAFTFHSVADAQGARKAAKDAYEQVLRIFAQGKGAGTGGDGAGDDVAADPLGVAKSERVRALADDRDLYVEIARLWADQEPGVERSLTAWQHAARIEAERADDAAAASDGGEAREDKKDAVDPRVRNNIAVCLFNRRGAGDAASAASLQRAEGEFELAISRVAGDFDGTLDGGETDALMTTVAFNLAACREALGNAERAKSEWEGLLTGHPEFVEAKARLALLAIKSRQRDQYDVAHQLIKEALTSQPSHPELRALYTYFLVETAQLRVARDFARATLKEVSRHDVYALCASGALSYLEARENKHQGKDAQRDRIAKFTRAAEFFDKALQLYPQCAFAAQGLAIGLAESTLGNGPADAGAAAGATTPGGTAAPLTEYQARLRNARDALNILTKVKESVNDASVYVNIAHCHFARDEYDRAIENYNTALRRYLHGKSGTVLWYLSRAYYHKSMKDQSFRDLQHAIEFGQKATDLNPADLANVFNMAILKQKGLELLANLPVEKRTSVELRAAYEHLQSSAVLFDQLANDTVEPSPYPKDVARQRRSYTTSLERRFAGLLEAQQAYEATESGKLEQARRAREAEQQRLDELERERLAQIQRQAEALAEQRKRMREEAEQWAALSKAWADEDDDDDGKKRKGGAGGKKRKSTKVKGGDEAEFTGESSDDGGEVDKPAKKKRAKKDPKPKKSKSKAKNRDGSQPMDVDEDDEDAPVRAKPLRRRKGKSSGMVKSAEYIHDSEEDDDEGDAGSPAAAASGADKQDDDDDEGTGGSPGQPTGDDEDDE
ncbi:uncharacterized protein JCM10292_006986 [Rhodotorula paludigena]|uniref:uncharacterized protein n=1 Tax=Rhodotorula paludigena TaxID=86838 RepID=UPI0031793865